MAVKIVTDTLSDITSDLADELGVTVVPLYVRFGEKIYRDRVEITSEEFYRRLVNASTLPSTTQPTPHDFIEVYQRLAEETDEVLVIVVSSKLSGTYSSAMQARQTISGKCRIEVVDSLTVAMGEGLITIAAAKAVKAGANLNEAADLARRAVSRSHLVTRVRSLSAGLDYLYNFVAGFKSIESVAVEHATTPDVADRLVERLGSLVPKENVYRSVISPVIGTYSGPSALALTVLEAEK